MANREHLELLRHGAEVWNAWRAKNPSVRPDLSDANLGQRNLNGVDLSKAVLAGANLGWAIIETDARGANLQGANLTGASLNHANLREADLRGATLAGVSLLGTDLRGANLTGCRVYGVSVWNAQISKETVQQNLVITPDRPELTVDNIEVAQFVYLLLHNEKIRDVIDTVGKKGVLLLGRFTEGRIEVLERLREALRKRDYVPIVFNFDKPATKDFT
jgi:Pentapeptide repeats (8 copies)